MKKLVILCALALLCGLCACEKTPEPTTLPTTAPVVETTVAPTEATTVPTTVQTEPTETSVTETTGVPGVFAFPQGTQLLGVDLSGLTVEDGYAAFCQRLSDYVLQITVNGTNVRVTGKTLGLSYPQEAFFAAADAIKAGEGAGFDQALSYNAAALQQALTDKLNRTAANASIRYNKTMGWFELRAGVNGQTVELTEVLEQADRQIRALGEGFKTEAPVTVQYPSVTAESNTAKTALEKANAMLELSITYTYAPEGTTVGTERLTREQLVSFITFDSGLHVQVDTDTVGEYAWQMNKKYQQDGGKGPFRTTYGTLVNLEVEYMGQGVDIDALTEDIRYCMENCLSGTRQAPYLDPGIYSEMPYNGTYIEVNLSAQRMWYYKNGKVVVQCPIVSGCVSKGWTTPNGVFAIYQKFTDSLISNGTAYVHCFMAYNGNYGLHDATWRDSFGGDIYLTDGSHGCTNMPKEEALTLYYNAPLGTKVILYGGATSVDMIQQQITGTDAYRVAADSAPFKLDAVAQQMGRPMQYVSSNPAVAEVAQDGMVTIRGEGKAEIKVSVDAYDNVTAGEKIIQLEVYSACLDGRHSYSPWQQTKEPTCAAGEETAVCACGDIQTRPVAPVAEHNHQWSVTTVPTCAEGQETGVCVCGDTQTRPVAPVEEHTPGQWTETTKPACGVVGEEVTSCGGCGTELKRPVDALEHDFTTGGEFCDRGCGAVNPEYQPPETSEPEQTEPEETDPEETEPENTEPQETEPESETLPTT